MVQRCKKTEKDSSEKLTVKAYLDDLMCDRFLLSKTAIGFCIKAFWAVYQKWLPKAFNSKHCEKPSAFPRQYLCRIFRECMKLAIM